MSEFPKACAHCGKVARDQNSLWQHTKAKHGRKAAQGMRPPRSRDDDEPSIADEVVSAIEASLTGEPVPEHLLLMFPDQFSREARAENRKAIAAAFDGLAARVKTGEDLDLAGEARALGISEQRLVRALGARGAIIPEFA